MAIKKNRITPQDIEDVIACGYPLAQIARESGVDRISLSKFRNHGQALKAADQAALIAWLQENDLWEDGADPAADTRPSQAAVKVPVQAFPLPSIAVPIRTALSEADLAAGMRRLDAQVRENDRLLLLDVEIEDGIWPFSEGEPSRQAKQVNEELRQGLAVEAVLRRVLDGSFPARHSATKPTTQADLIANDFLGTLADESPTPANSSAGLAAASDDTAGGEENPEEDDGLPGPFSFLNDKKAA